MIEPIALEIAYQDPAQLFKRFTHMDGALLLESVNCNTPYENTNRYSYIAIDPYETITLTDNKPFVVLQETLKKFTIAKNPYLPPFQAGMAGYFSYDLCQYLENIGLQNTREVFPEMIIGLYDTVISFDHHLKQAWIVATGFPEIDYNERQVRAKRRIAEFKQLIEITDINNDYDSRQDAEVWLTTNFSEHEYIDAVKAAQNYILDGDIFEVNLAQRFSAKLSDNFNTFSLYERLREINPAPFAAYANFGKYKIISASPERFILLNNKKVETRPIKGTAPRHNNTQEDKIVADNLRNSQKDRAENIMIVDLMRNDLSKVCEDESVIVEKLCSLETFATVHHLVSVISGKLSIEKTAIDLLEATFPGGSITGAPKIRAMEIISELEPNRRGPYCGSVGFISFTGDMDTSILIRTFVIKDQTITFHAGGAVVLDSDPKQEYEETLIKAKALREALEYCCYLKC